MSTAVAEVPAVKTIIVSKATEWPAAADITENAVVATVRGELTFPLRPISYAQEQANFTDIPTPQPPEIETRRGVKEKNVKDKKFQAECTEVGLKRRVATIDKCWKTLPGDTIEQKTQWAQENLWRGGDLLNLYGKIIVLSGFSTGRKEASNESLVMASPEDWVNASRAPVVYSFDRAGQTISFKLHGISGTRIKQIESLTDAGAPPLKPSVAPDGTIKGSPVPNPTDPEYLRRCEEKTIHRNILFLEQGLGFEIPGANMTEKTAWIGARPAGEVSELVAFLKNDVLAYREHADFM